jgi:hypothetical protein
MGVIDGMPTLNGSDLDPGDSSDGRLRKLHINVFLNKEESFKYINGIKTVDLITCH